MKKTHRGGIRTARAILKKLLALTASEWKTDRLYKALTGSIYLTLEHKVHGWLVKVRIADHAETSEFHARADVVITSICSDVDWPSMIQAINSGDCRGEEW